MIYRKIAQHIESTKKSILLLGPRQVGKSTLIKSLNPDLSLNLSLQNLFLDMAANPNYLLEQINIHKPKTIFIDEVQRLPTVLNTIQALVDDDKTLRFFLTGSSARKLKRGRANLLPGRIVSYQMGPFVSSEFDYKMDSSRLLAFGALPEIYLSAKDHEKKKILLSYVGNYLKEEIHAEALTRNLESFMRFFNLISGEVGHFIDYSKLAKHAKISRHSCSRYFETLEDTLVGYRLFPFKQCVENVDLIKHPKFYFFDVGIYNALQKNFEVSQDRLGNLAEQLVFTQILHSAHCHDKSITPYTFRTRAGVEIDFIFEIERDIFAIEVKASDNLNPHDVKSLQYFKNYYPQRHTSMVLHLGRQRRKIDGVWCLPWQDGLKEIGL